jgi:phage antirepressor YoqD-like protein
VTQLDLLSSTSPFDAIMRKDGRGEYWLARELMPLLGYDKWERFEDVIERAAISAGTIGFDVDQAFSRQREEGTGGRPRVDYRLTRHAAYLTAMNGDVRKDPVAAAQTYFAAKTREAEVAPVVAAQSLPQTYPQALRELASTVERADLAEARTAELEPMAAQAEQHRVADGLRAVDDFANDVQDWAKRELGLRILHKDVRDFLGEIGLIIRGNTVRNNQPTAFGIARGFVKAKNSDYARHDGSAHTAVTSRLTPAGEGWAWDRIHKRIAETGSLRKATTTDIERKTA